MAKINGSKITLAELDKELSNKIYQIDKQVFEIRKSQLDALIEKTFPKSCLMVNTVVELRNENKEVVERYHKYFDSLIESYRIVLTKAFKLGQIKNESKIDEYAEFVLGIIFALAVLYKIHDKAYLQNYIDEQLAFIQ